MNSNRSERPDYDDGSPLGTERSHVMQMAGFLRKQDSISAWIESEPLAARATVSGDHVTWLLSGVSVPGEYTMFVSHFPGRVPVERRTACAEAITRANSRLGLGAFELNLDNGLLIFRTAIPATTRNIDPLGLGWMLAIHQDVFDHYFEALMSVIYGIRTILKHALSEAPSWTTLASQMNLPRTPC
jgi:hypothetical protein